jgi:hypothetical protein
VIRDVRDPDRIRVFEDRLRAYEDRKTTTTMDELWRRRHELRELRERQSWRAVLDEVWRRRHGG